MDTEPSQINNDKINTGIGIITIITILFGSKNPRIKNKNLNQVSWSGANRIQ